MKLIGIQKRDVGVGPPEAVSFDGDTDYLSRSSDLVGNVDSKTFTFSCWVYRSSEDIMYFLHARPDSSNNISIWSNTSGVVNIRFKALNNEVVQFNINSGVVLNTYVHVLFSFDSANVSNRHVYVNDVVGDVTWVNYNNLVSAVGSPINIGSTTTPTELVKGRLAHTFLDYTYRDLSIEANRRLFLTEDLKPARGQAGLSPILYLPMEDKETAHINGGTGGNFVQNGVLETAQRGPNQDNCVASEFDGVDDSLQSSGIGSSNSKQATVSFNFKVDTDNSNGGYILRADESVSVVRMILEWEYPDNQIRFYAKDSGNTDVFRVIIQDRLIQGQENHLTITLDSSSPATRYIELNGEIIDISWANYNDTIMDLSGLANIFVAKQNLTSDSLNFEGTLGELYFDTEYIDLSDSNPFWDSETNLPIPVRQVIENTGHQPLIAMPIRADNPEENLGTGGDFTLNSGPLVGARGGSEFWARSAEFDGNVLNYMQGGSLPDTSASDELSFVLSVTNRSGSDDSRVLLFVDDTPGRYFVRVNFDSSTSDIDIYLRDSSAGIVFLTTGVGNTSPTAFETIFVSYSKVSNALSFAYDSAGNAYPAGNWSNNGVDLASITKAIIGQNNPAGNPLDGDLGNVYLTNQYIDFSDESNRNLFIDQLGYPIDLTDAIAEGTIPEPLIYMPFDEADNLGKNNGTGGDFTVNGTVTQGPDVDPNS